MSSRSRGQKAGRMSDGWEVRGGYMNAKKQKLQDQFNETAGKDNGDTTIFRGVSIYVNGYTEPSSDELKRLISIHGGQYQHYYTVRHVTHVIATNLPDSKIRNIKQKKVISPKWIVESVEAGRLLSHVPYQLYTALGGQQKGLSFANSILPTATVCSEHSSLHEVPNVDQNVPTVVEQQLCENTFETHSDISVSQPNDETDRRLASMSESCRESFRMFTNVGGLCLNTSDVNKSTKRSTSKEQTAKKGLSAKAGSTEFVSDFYKNSRLHFLSTWGVEFKEFVNNLQHRHTGVFPGRENLLQYAQDRETPSDSDFSKRKQRVIMHVDMDCYFVSVGLLDRPDLVGKPVAVTHSKGQGSKPREGTDIEYERRYWRAKKGAIIGQDNFDTDSEEDDTAGGPSATHTAGGPSATHTNKKGESSSMSEIASCSYEARKAGVKNGMFMGRAKELCPQLVPIPYNFEKYRSISQTLYETVASYTHDIEAVSCDEMFIDCTRLLEQTNVTPLEFAAVLRNEIKEKTRCTASAGIARNIMLAKMATKKAKPNGQFYLLEEEGKEFIAGQPVSDLPGVGWSMGNKLKDMHVVTCGDLQNVAMSTLQAEFGPKTGLTLYEHCRGEDSRPVQMDKERKSVSAEINYGIRFTEDSEAVSFIEELANEVQQRLESAKVKGKTVTLKLKVRKAGAPMETAKFLGHGICDNITRSATLPVATDDAKFIAKECLILLKQTKAKPEDLRGIGIQIHKLESQAHSAKQSTLNFRKSARLSEAAPQLRNCDQNTLDNPVSSNRPLNNQALPPLPTMSTSLSPTESAPVTIRPLKYQPLPSQVDPDVLKELPEDVRREIECQMTREKSCEQSDPKTTTVPPDPGCSHWENVAKDIPKKTASHIPLPSLSELDISCLEALPYEMQREIKNAYAQQHNAPVGCSWLNSKGSPIAKSSTMIRRSPGTHKQIELARKNPSLKAPVGKSANGNSFSPKRLKYPTMTNTVNRENVLKETDSSRTAPICKSIPSLCGVTTVPEVKSLLGEWLLSQDGPEEEDLSHITQYLAELVLDKNLERVYVILKFLNRQVHKVNSSVWERSFDKILKETQSIVQNVYGCPLKW